MAKTVCKLLGIVFILVGVAGFVAPKLLGAHLNPAHNAVHLVSGVIALYFGFAGSAGAGRGLFVFFLLCWFTVGAVRECLCGGTYPAVRMRALDLCLCMDVCSPTLP